MHHRRGESSSVKDQNWKVCPNLGHHCPQKGTYCDAKVADDGPLQAHSAKKAHRDWGHTEDCVWARLSFLQVRSQQMWHVVRRKV